MIVLVDERIDRACEGALSERGYEIIKLSACDVLQEPVSAHPDMLVFVGKGRLFCHERYYAAAREWLDEICRKSKLELVLSREEWGEKYPADVLFNAAPMGERIICNIKSVSKHIIEAYGEENVINTRQGYSKCSVVTVGDNALITADTSIAKAATAAGIDVLLLLDSDTALDGYSTGFIGGASGDDGEHIFFTGNIEAHPEWHRIKTFCEAHGKVAVSLSKSPLYDYGTLIFLRT